MNKNKMNSNKSISGLTFHHVGLLIENIENSVQHYAELFGENNISEIFTLNSQKIKECFVKNSDNSYIGLVQPLGEDSVVYNLLKKRVSYYHIAYKVNNIHCMVERLEKLNYKALEFFNSEAFAGNECIFLFTPDAHLIELIEE